MKFECPYCKQPYEGERSYLGKTLTCNNCKKEFTVGMKLIEKKEKKIFKDIKFTFHIIEGVIIFTLIILLSLSYYKNVKQNKEIEKQNNKVCEQIETISNLEVEVARLKTFAKLDALKISNLEDQVEVGQAIIEKINNDNEKLANLYLAAKETIAEQNKALMTTTENYLDLSRKYIDLAKRHVNR